MFVLDTDSITHEQEAHPVLSEKVRTTPREFLFTTSVTVEEQVKGRLAYIHRFRDSPQRIALGHDDLVNTVLYYRNWSILRYDEDADAIVRGLRKQRVRIGSQDLRIAAIALKYAYTLVTSNRRDFVQVPNLNIDDWTVPARTKT